MSAGSVEGKMLIINSINYHLPIRSGEEDNVVIL